MDEQGKSSAQDGTGSVKLSENQSLIDFFMLSEGMQFATMAEKITHVFRLNREDNNNKIYASIMNMRNLRELVSVQVEMLSLRQRMLEDSHILLDKLTQLRKEYRIKKGTAYDMIINNLQLRTKTSGEKEAIVEGSADIAELRNKVEILERQTEYYTESIRTVDDILYGIKTRLDIERLLGT